MRSPTTRGESAKLVTSPNGSIMAKGFGIKRLVSGDLLLDSEMVEHALAGGLSETTSQLRSSCERPQGIAQQGSIFGRHNQAADSVFEEIARTGYVRCNTCFPAGHSLEKGHRATFHPPPGPR